MPDKAKWFILTPLDGINPAADTQITKESIKKILNTQMEIKGSYKSGIWKKCICKKFTPNEYVTYAAAPPIQ